MTGSAKGRAWRGGRRGERTESVIPLPLFAVATLVELGVPDVSYHSFRKTVGTLIDGRVKVIGRLPGEATCLSLVWAVLDRGQPRLARRHPDIGDHPPAARPPRAAP